MGGPNEKQKGLNLHMAIKEIIEPKNPGEHVQIPHKHVISGLPKEEDRTITWEGLEESDSYQQIEHRWRTRHTWWTLRELRNAKREMTQDPAEDEDDEQAFDNLGRDQALVNPVRENAVVKATRRRKRRAEARTTDEHCDACGKEGDDHEGIGDIKWTGCDNCGRWYVKDCRDAKDLEDSEGPDWKCYECTNTQRKLGRMVNQWNDAESGWATVNQRLDQIEITTSLIRDSWLQRPEKKTSKTRPGRKNRTTL